MDIFEKADVRPNSKGFPQISFKLFKGIEPIISANKVVAYRFLYDDLALDSEGKIFIPGNKAVIGSILDFPNSYTKEEIGLNEDESNELEILEEKNNEEFIKLLERIEELKTFENDTTERISRCLDEFRFKFTQWYKKNNLTKPDLKESADKEKGNDEKIKVPTVKEFINKYLSDKKIQIENVENKSVLEDEIHSAWKKEYPNYPRSLSSFHRELPREA